MATGSSGSKPRHPPRKGGAPAVAVLRVGHRPGRDPRLTTHLALVARAFGAERLFLHPPDEDLARRIDGVRHRWGGTFGVTGVTDWKGMVRSFDGAVIHLTMYGIPFEKMLPTLKAQSRLLLVVGGAKVPPDLYRLATYNVAVGAQPHSEVGAVAVLLDRLRGPEPPARFRNAQQRIVPRPCGKRVVVARSRKEG